jgi:hypothetical protein
MVDKFQWLKIMNKLDITNLPSKLLVTITFFYAENRLVYLKETCRDIADFANEAHIVIITNTSNKDEHARILKVMPSSYVTVEIRHPNMIGHPFLLAWFHLDVFREHYTDESISHFLYLEDDIKLNRDNILYWMKGREQLRSRNLIPSFLRYEINALSNQIVLTDIRKKMIYELRSKVVLPNNYAYVCSNNPYQGMYMLDRELMAEHLSDSSLKPEYNQWGIREIAAQGLTFCNVPKGYSSRNLFGYDLNKNNIDKKCLIFHIPSNYANNAKTKFGKIVPEKAIVKFF